MIVNRYKGWRAIVKRGTVFRKISYQIIKPKIMKKRAAIMRDKAIFEQVEIETINRCNGICPFCPVNHNDDPREFKKMDEDLFHKIIDELAELEYTGTVGLYSNNEPFLDNRMADFIKYARKKLPNAFIHVYTNGEVLTPELFLEVMPCLSRMVVDNYNDDLELNKNSIWIKQYCDNDPELDKKVEIHLRKINEILYTRGGQAPNNQKKQTLDMPCLLPFEQLIIRPDGKVSLCCNDALGTYTMGDCNTESLMDIWHGKAFTGMRNRLMQGRQGIRLCEYCDTVSL